MFCCDYFCTCNPNINDDTDPSQKVQSYINNKRKGIKIYLLWLNYSCYKMSCSLQCRNKSVACFFFCEKVGFVSIRVSEKKRIERLIIFVNFSMCGGGEQKFVNSVVKTKKSSEIGPKLQKLFFYQNSCNTYQHKEKNWLSLFVSKKWLMVDARWIGFEGNDPKTSFWFTMSTKLASFCKSLTASTKSMMKFVVECVFLKNFLKKYTMFF